MQEHAGTPPNKKATISGGKLLLIFGLMWVAALIGVYFVVVQLKLGGEQGIRVPEAQSESTVGG